MATDIDAYFANAKRWRDESERLRVVLLDCGLEEAIKWGKPCYGTGSANIAIMQPMKAFLALMFFRGALIDDPDGVLEKQGENSRSARRVCFTSVEQVDQMGATVRALVRGAIAVEEAGLSLPERPELVLAEELRERLDADPALKAAFESLTPGRQRAYNLYVCGAKQANTRARRVEQHVPRILAGKGLRDR